MLARYYSAGLSRFLSVDPGDDTDPENPQSWNRYAYVRNNPLSHFDPDGREVTYAPNPEAQQMRSSVEGLSAQSATFRAEIQAHSGASPDLNFIGLGDLSLGEKGHAHGRIEPGTNQYQYTNVEVNPKEHFGKGDLQRTVIEEVAHANDFRTNSKQALQEQLAGNERGTEVRSRQFIKQVNKEVRQSKRGASKGGNRGSSSGKGFMTPKQGTGPGQIKFKPSKGCMAGC
jgi:uncharacterized protein RhaS with RHS repeats